MPPRRGIATAMVAGAVAAAARCGVASARAGTLRWPSVLVPGRVPLWRRLGHWRLGRRHSATTEAASGMGIADGGAGDRPRRATRPPQVHTDAFPTPDSISLRTIAVVRSPYKERFGCPRQPTVTAGVVGGAELRGSIDFVAGDSDGDDIALALRDLDGFEYLWVIAYLHLNQGWSPRVTPPRGPRQKRGLFATRAPHRPNHISLSACRLIDVDCVARRITIEGLDLLDGTPVLDVKPYVPYCDSYPRARAGWLDEMGGAGASASASAEPDHLAYSPPPPHLQS
eukprot:CAMPEP_0117507296 /NCGR_PEP_ID=MMETSP0784-20121206/26351_1 /TAXON_ID=39447 /ORGANISM="" /LENGTH=283 /DNA_ID=CAMNT_0005302797 /DNA_START=23 /DNA_END=874 /DNA_ORIENTATION=+